MTGHRQHSGHDRAKSEVKRRLRAEMAGVALTERMNDCPRQAGPANGRGSYPLPPWMALKRIDLRHELMAKRQDGTVQAENARRSGAKAAVHKSRSRRIGAST